MKEYILKAFSRLFTVLGCSTLVTACYGVPYYDYQVKLSGEVTDAETGDPVEGILVKMTVGSYSQGGDQAVHSISPLAPTMEAYTDAEGRFQTQVGLHQEAPDGVLLECFDVDGESNGSYMPESKVCSLAEGENAHLLLEKTTK